MKKIIFLFCLVLFNGVVGFAQEDAPNNNWVINNSTRFNFNNYGIVETNQEIPLDETYTESPAFTTVSDGCGKLLFVTDGLYVWRYLNGAYVKVNDGSPLIGMDMSVRQRVVVVPAPYCPTSFYIITIGNYGVYYSEYNIDDYETPGWISNMNVPLWNSPCTALTVGLHTNIQYGGGIEGYNKYRLMIYDSVSKSMETFFISQSGINHESGLSYGLSNLINIYGDYVNHIKIAPDGDLYVLATDQGELFSGRFSNYFDMFSSFFSAYEEITGVEFSPDSRTAYFSTGNYLYTSWLSYPNNYFAGGSGILVDFSEIDTENHPLGDLQLDSNGLIWGTFQNTSYLLKIDYGDVGFQEAPEYQNSKLNLQQRIPLWSNAPYIKVTPKFTQIPQICLDDQASDPFIDLNMGTSLNGIPGEWSPDFDNTQTMVYHFTPSGCASQTEMTVHVKPTITPTFDSVTAINEGDSIDPLPTVSKEWIYGIWEPELVNTITQEYTFTPAEGQCTNITAQLTVEVFPLQTNTGSTVTNVNTIKKTVYKKETTTSKSNPAPEEAMVQITYFDGLGRPIQQKSLKQSDGGKDIVVPIAYDAFGRQFREYLPYVNTATSDQYEDNALTAVEAYYGGSDVSQNGDPNFEHTANCYSQKIFENSPLNRVKGIAAPGEDWKAGVGTDHTIKFDFQTNSLSEVKLFKAVNNQLVNSGSYAQSQLFKTVTKNENWTGGTDNTTEEYKDKEGKPVLKRAYNSGAIYDTYYVYDQFGNLTYVLPPISSTSSSVPSQGSLDAYCYQYKYDTKNRLVEKKLPGKGWEYIVYDKLNRVVATGPALSPFTDSQGATGCMIVKYDVFGRVVLTGWMPTGADRATLQAGADGAAVFNETKTTSPTTVNQVAFSYTTGAWPTGNYHVLTVNYYDNYSSNLTFAPAISFVTGGYNNSDKLPKGLPTMSWARVCEASTNYRAEQSYIVYDKKGHVVTSYKDNYLGGYTKVESEVQAITGRVNQTITTHKKSSDIADETLAITDSLSYTDQDRLLKHLHKIGNGNWQLLSKNQYNALGQLISKRVGSKGNGDVDLGLQKVDYSYNVRGWLKGINNIGNLLEPGLNADLFAYKINYNATENPEGESQYNGNISEITWKTSDNIARRYNYSYDDLNRMTEGGYSTPDDNTNVFNFYGESVQYNKGGNIIGLQRREEAEGTSQTNVIDDLTYSYSGNKLMSVTESPYTSTGTGGFIDGNITGNDYDYDSFGNQIKDLNKGITQISYNHLNLPTKITFGTTGTIEYLYNATGQKVSKKVTEGATITETNYLDGFQYQNNELELFPHAGGYIKPMMVNNVFTYSYVFNYTDHLGNVRISYSDIDKNGILGPGVFSGGEDLGCIGSDCRVHFISSILEENNYYPFGLKHQGYNYSNGGNNYKFNGQEYQDELGLNTTAMDYRQYDNAIGRFNCIDPLAENHPDMTPYHFGANNPVYFSDPSGLDIILTGRNMVTFTGDEAGAFFNAWNSGGRTTVHNSQYNSIYTGAETAVDYAQTVLLDLQFGLLGGGGGGAYVALPEMVVPNGVSIDSDRFWNIAMGHTYWNSPYYDSWRGTQHANQWLDFGQGLQDVGDGMFMLGAGLSTTGIGATVGAPLITIGEGISTLGLGVKWTTNIVRGNFDLGNFVIDGALHLVPDQYEKAFGQGADYILIQMGSIGSGRWFDYMNSLHK